MDIKVFSLQSKIKRLLYKFLEGKCPKRIEEHFDKMFALLWKQEETEVESTVLALPTFAEWLKEAVITWNSTKTTVPSTVVSFTMNLASLVSKNEDRFCNLNTNNFFIKLINISKARQTGATSSIKLEYIRLLSSFLEHKSGIEWMIVCNFWEDIHKLSVSSENEQIVKESILFMSKILEKTLDSDESFCDDIIKKLMTPLGESVYKSLKSSSDAHVSDELASRQLKPTLQMIGNIMEYFLQGIYFGKKDFGVVLLFLKNFHLEERISDFMVIAQSKCLVFDLGKIMFVMQFLELYVKTVTQGASATSIDTTINRMKSNFVTNISKGDFTSVLQFSKFGVLYWSLIDSKIVVPRKNDTASVCTIQMFYMLLIPTYLSFMKYCAVSVAEWEEESFADEIRSIFEDKVFKFITHDVIRVFYAWRDPLIAREDLFSFCIQCFIYMKESLQFLNRSQGVIIFQEFIYLVKDLMKKMREFPDKLCIYFQEPSYFKYAFEVLYRLIEEFQITWKDSVEAIELLDLLFDFLSLHNWPADVIVQILKLINIAVVKYMSPNLALLVENTADSIIDMLGTLVSAKLYSEVLEVKLSALEVTCTMASLSMSKEICPKHLEEHFNKFFILLWKQEETEVQSTLIAVPIFAEWLKEAVITWNATKRTPPTSIMSFSMNLASLVSKNEESFCNLNVNNFFIKLINISKARQVVGAASSIKLGYIKLLSSFLEHKSGIEWMIASNFWEDIYKMSISNEDPHILVESTKLMANLLEKSIDSDENFCEDVIKKMMMPLGENVYKSFKSSDADISDEDISQQLKPTLQLIGNILEYFLREIYLQNKHFDTVFLFLKNFHLEERISDFMVIAQLKCLVFDLGKIMFIMQFLELYVETVARCNVNVATVDRIRNNFVANISKLDIESIIKFSNFGVLYWNLMDSKIPAARQNKRDGDLALQVFCFMFIPTYYSVVKYCKSLSQMEEDNLADDLRCMYEEKVWKMISQDWIRVFFSLREPLLARQDLLTLSILTFTYIKEALPYLKKNQGVIMFQEYIYIFKDIVYSMRESPEKLEIFEKEPTYFTHAFEFIKLLIEKFQITWKDSVEAIELIDLSFEFLSLYSWPSHVIVQVLELVNVAIVKYMSPNLALLVENPTDSIMDALGFLVSAKLYCEVAEVKGCALEVICTMASLSANKSELTTRSVFSTWLKKAVLTWSTKIVTPSTNIASFTLTLASLLSKNEEMFCCLNANNFFVKLVNVLKVRQNNEFPSIKLAYIKLLSSFLEHKSGIEWMIACNFWEDIVQMCFTCENEEVVKDSTCFMSLFLDNVIDHDEDFCDKVVKRILLPLGENVYKALKICDSMDEVTDKVSSEYLQPQLKLMGNILTYFLKGILVQEKEFDVVFIFLRNFHLEERISDFMMIAQNKYPFFDISKIMFIIQFLELYVKSSTHTISKGELSASINRIRTTFVANFSKGNYTNVLQFCDFAFLYWKLVDSRILTPQTKRMSIDVTSFLDQVVLFLTLPCVCLTIRHCFSTYGKLEEGYGDEIRSIVSDKIFKLLTHDFFRVFYVWRDHLIAHPNIFKICTFGLNCIEHSYTYLSAEQAVITFQVLIYMTKDVINIVKKIPEKCEIFLKEPQYLSNIFRVLSILIENFHITWKDSLEVVDVMDLSFDFLTSSQWPDDVVVQVLKLINVATGKYMSPNLALLVDSTTGSTIDLLGPLLYLKSRESLEVRKASLDVIFTVAHLSADKSTLTTFTVFSQWLKKAVSAWHTKGIKPSTSIASFSLNLASLLSKTEDEFCSLNSNNFYIKLVAVLKARQSDADPSIKLAYIKLLCSFLEHKSGIEWMMACNFWEIALDMSLSSDNEEIISRSTQFLALFLDKTVVYDDDFSNSVVRRILLPLGENLYKALKTSTHELASQYLRPQLKLINDILEYFLEGVHLCNKDFQVLLIFFKHLHLEERISDFMTIAQNRHLFFDINRIMLILHFLELYVKTSTNSINSTQLDASLSRIRSTCVTNCSKEVNYEVILQFCAFGVLYWNLVISKILIPGVPNKEWLSVTDELLLLLIIPNSCLLVRHHYLTFTKLDENFVDDETRFGFFNKIIKRTSNESFRFFFVWRDRLVQNPSIFNICIQCCTYTKQLQKYFSTEQAVLISQFLIYIIQDIICIVTKYPDKLPIFLKEPSYFSHIFQVLAILLRNFNITWKDSLEVVNVMSLCFEFLELHQWNEDVIVHVLKLINVATCKYMSPNLALLVDSTTDSTVDLLGPLLYAKSSDGLEVRKVAFEVIHTIAQLSASKLERGLITHPIFTKWIAQTVTTWATNGVTPTPSIAFFTLNLASFLSKDEERFCSLNNNNFFIKLVKVLKVRQVPTAPSVTLAYIKLLSAFLDHKSGLELMIACNFWEDIYDLSVSQKSDEIIEQSTKFMAKILEKSVDYDESFCNRVIKKMMLPLGENIYRSLKASPNDVDIRDEVAILHLKPTLKLIGDVLIYFLDGIYLQKADFGVALLFLKNFHLEERISDFMIIAQSKCLVLYLAKIMFIMQFLELYVKKITNCVSFANIDASLNRIKSNFLDNMAKMKYENVAEFCHFGILYWNLIDTKISIETFNAISFSKSLCMMLMTCNFCILFRYCFSTFAELEEVVVNDEIREIYVNNVMKFISKEMMRIFYGWRDVLIAHPKLFVVCRKSLNYSKESRKYFTPDQGRLLFQSLMYLLLDVIRSLKENPEKIEPFLKEPEYCCGIFEILRLCIEEFEIQWKDSYETIEVLDLCFDFLTLPEWPSVVVVEILKLLNLAIAKYMSPNLALLADGASDSSITLLGPLLYSKLRNNETKIAALEVINTVTAISCSKFPSLQKVLMDSELPTLVVKMSTCDGESFVRATAIKCLQEMIQVEEIWNNALKTEDLPQKMRDVLLNETEGIVRVEAATFMCVAYEHQQFQKENLDQIYETMIYSSTTDLHWEVKVRALNFWDKVIKNHLQNQGMIDDSFPNVTFSKEHRKIVTLTDSEIRKRLLKVLNQLSSIGCLGVLMSAIKDDCDMEVSKTAVKITQRLVDLFKKYNLRSDCSAPTSPAPTENGTVSLSSGVSVDESMDSPRSSHPDLNEEIIDQIVNSKDVCLLKTVYSPSDYGSVSNYDIQVRKVVTPNEFLQFTQQDLNSLIADKKNWLNGIEDLGSLLDDMLKTYEDDVNNMDCY